MTAGALSINRYSMVSPVLSADTKKKIKILGRSADPVAALASMVAPDQIPEWLGGTSTAGTFTLLFGDLVRWYQGKILCGGGPLFTQVERLEARRRRLGAEQGRECASVMWPAVMRSCDHVSSGALYSCRGVL